MRVAHSLLSYSEDKELKIKDFNNNGIKAPLFQWKFIIESCCAKHYRINRTIAISTRDSMMQRKGKIEQK